MSIICQYKWGGRSQFADIFGRDNYIPSPTSILTFFLGNRTQLFELGTSPPTMKDCISHPPSYLGAVTKFVAMSCWWPLLRMSRKAVKGKPPHLNGS